MLCIFNDNNNSKISHFIPKRSNFNKNTPQKDRRKLPQRAFSIFYLWKRNVLIIGNWKPQRSEKNKVRIDWNDLDEFFFFFFLFSENTPKFFSSIFLSDRCLWGESQYRALAFNSLRDGWSRIDAEFRGKSNILFLKCIFVISITISVIESFEGISIDILRNWRIT